MWLSDSPLVSSWTNDPCSPYRTSLLLLADLNFWSTVSDISNNSGLLFISGLTCSPSTRGDGVLSCSSSITLTQPPNLVTRVLLKSWVSLCYWWEKLVSSSNTTRFFGLIYSLSILFLIVKSLMTNCTCISLLAASGLTMVRT